MLKILFLIYNSRCIFHILMIGDIIFLMSMFIQEHSAMFIQENYNIQNSLENYSFKRI